MPKSLPFCTKIFKNYLRLGMGVGGGGGVGAARPSGPYAYAVFIWSSQSDSRTTGTTEATIWQPGFIRKMETARDDYMQTRLNAGFLTSGTTGDFID